MTFTINASNVSCERCGMAAPYNWDGINVCGSGCYEILQISKGNTSKSMLAFKISKLIGQSHQDIADAIGNVVKVGEAEGIKIGASTYSRYYPEWDSWVIELNKYHRDNLIWLFNSIGYPYTAAGHTGVEPFHFANTGDWVGEVPLMLRKPAQSDPVLDENDRPNKTVAQLRSDVEGWLKRK